MTPISYDYIMEYMTKREHYLAWYIWEESASPVSVATTAINAGETANMNKRAW